MKQFLLLLSCFTCTLLNAQKIDERPATHQAGECRTKSSYLFHKESKSTKVFVIDVSEDGNYFLDMFLLVSGTTPYEVLIDDIAPAGVVKSSSNSWQFVFLQDSVGRPKTIPLYTNAA